MQPQRNRKLCKFNKDQYCNYSTEFKKPEPNCTEFCKTLYVLIFYNVAHGMEPGETPSNLVSHKAPTMVKQRQKRQLMD